MTADIDSEEMQEMRGVVMHEAGDVRVEEREDPKLVDPTDAVIRLTSTCICGSDLALPGGRAR